MGCPDGGNDWCAALCLRRRNDTAAAAVAVGRDEHGECGSLHDHRPGYKDHESRSTENRYGVEAFCLVYSFCNAVLFPVRDGCESGWVKKAKKTSTVYEPYIDEVHIEKIWIICEDLIKSGKIAESSWDIRREILQEIIQGEYFDEYGV